MYPLPFGWLITFSLSSPFRISESIVWPQAPLCESLPVYLDYVATAWVTDLGSLILLFWHLIVADSANFRDCSSLGSVCSILLFSAEPSGGLILSCCSFPFFIAFHYFCGRHSGRLKRHVFPFLTQSRKIQKKRRSKHHFYWHRFLAFPVVLICFFKKPKPLESLNKSRDKT